MKDRAVLIGAPTPLVGIITEPQEFDKNKPMVLILNSGVMHRVGTCRMSVKIARQLAALGFASIRFDFSGIGDSESRRGTESFEISGPKEAIEVMNFLQKKRGVSEFILYGLCSGSDASYETALLDRRVIAIAQIDAYCYRTVNTVIHYLRLKMFNKNAWAGLLKRAYNRIFKRSKLGPESAEEHVEVASYVRVFPPQKKIEAGLNVLLARGVQMHVIFTGADKNLYNYTEQYRESFKRNVDFKNLLDVHYLSESSHIVTEPKFQKIIVEGIAQWVAKICSARVTADKKTVDA